jgi:hypothetical protein
VIEDAVDHLGLRDEGNDAHDLPAAGTFQGPNLETEGRNGGDLERLVLPPFHLSALTCAALDFSSYLRSNIITN